LYNEEWFPVMMRRRSGRLLWLGPIATMSTLVLLGVTPSSATHAVGVLQDCAPPFSRMRDVRVFAATSSTDGFAVGQRTVLRVGSSAIPVVIASVQHVPLRDVQALRRNHAPPSDRSQNMCAGDLPPVARGMRAMTLLLGPKRVSPRVLTRDSAAVRTHAR
jgi:hypothetical protein